LIPQAPLHVLSLRKKGENVQKDDYKEREVEIEVESAKFENQEMEEKKI
jgi:hypothetical protein